MAGVFDSVVDARTLRLGPAVVRAFDQKGEEKGKPAVEELILRFEDLTFGDRVAGGSFGEVFRGSWKHNDVAIKTLFVKFFTPEALAEFRKEATIMFKMRSDYIVHLRGYCEFPSYCLVMEYLPLGSLYQLLHNGQELPWRLRLRIALDVSYGLAQLHDAGILHRDLKSLNVLIHDSGGWLRAKLTDFGASKMKTETQTATKLADSAVGTLAWLAPELLRRDGTFTAQADMYSFGMVLWEIATRKTPFASASNFDVLRSWIKDGEKEIVPEDVLRDLPDFAALIVECWKQGGQRPDAEQAAARLQQLFDTETKQQTAQASTQHSAVSTGAQVALVDSPVLEQKTPSSEVQVFLRLVAEGEQDQAEAMLKSNPTLAFAAGDVTDLSKRTFRSITAFQYAVWALDWHMWTMIRRYLPDAEAKQQAEGFARGRWVKTHGVHAQHLLEDLVDSLRVTKECYLAGKYDKTMTMWIRKVGAAQLLLPAHVINEYCHPTRSLSPPNVQIPDWKDMAALPRSGTDMWFTKTQCGGKLGDKFAVYRGHEKYPHFLGEGYNIGSCVQTEDCYCDGCGFSAGAGQDSESIHALTLTRKAQREELVAALTAKSEEK